MGAHKSRSSGNGSYSARLRVEEATMDTEPGPVAERANQHPVAPGRLCPACEREIGWWPLVKPHWRIRCPHCGLRLKCADAERLFAAVSAACAIVLLAALATSDSLRSEPVQAVLLGATALLFFVAGPCIVLLVTKRKKLIAAQKNEVCGPVEERPRRWPLIAGAAFAGLCLLSLWVASLRPAPLFTERQYDAIRPGMTLPQVEAIMGGPPRRRTGQGSRYGVIRGEPMRLVAEYCADESGPKPKYWVDNNAEVVVWLEGGTVSAKAFAVPDDSRAATLSRLTRWLRRTLGR